MEETRTNQRLPKQKSHFVRHDEGNLPLSRQNHTLSWVGKDLKRSLSPTSGSTQDHPKFKLGFWEHWPDGSWNLAASMSVWLLITLVIPLSAHGLLDAGLSFSKRFHSLLWELSETGSSHVSVPLMLPGGQYSMGGLLAGHRGCLNVIASNEAKRCIQLLVWNGSV